MPRLRLEDAATDHAPCATLVALTVRERVARTFGRVAEGAGRRPARPSWRDTDCIDIWAMDGDSQHSHEVAGRWLLRPDLDLASSSRLAAQNERRAGETSQAGRRASWSGVRPSADS
jgi:hypothetical protein